MYIRLQLEILYSSIITDRTGIELSQPVNLTKQTQPDYMYIYNTSGSLSDVTYVHIHVTILLSHVGGNEHMWTKANTFVKTREPIQA